MKTPALVAIISALHLLAAGAFFFIQGCGTQQARIEPPPAPVLPSTEAPRMDRVVGAPPPMFRPPVPVETAPPVMDFGGEETYVVKSGDTLSEIAKRHGVTTRELSELNGLSNANVIRVGQKLLLPAYAQSVSAERKPVAATRSSAAGSVYTVKRGDTLSAIAVQCGTTVKALRSSNNLRGDKILVGQKLTIPGGASNPVPAKQPRKVKKTKPVQPVAPKTTVKMVQPQERVKKPAPVPEPLQLAPEKAYEYKVIEGDTLESIARNFVVLKEDLMAINDIEDPESVRPGQILIIPTGTTTSSQ